MTVSGHEPTSFGLGSLMSAFSGPALASTLRMVQSFVPRAMMAPPPFYYPPEEPADLHLSVQIPPVSVGYSWAEALSALFPIISMTGMCVGMGAIIGLTSGACDRESKGEVLLEDSASDLSEFEQAIVQSPVERRKARRRRISAPQVFHLYEISKLE